MRSLKNVARRLARPFTAPIDGRVADINRRVGDARSSVEVVDKELGVVSDELGRLTRELAAYGTVATESNAYVGIEMRKVQESLDKLETRVLARVEVSQEEAYVARLSSAAGAPLEDLDGAVANLINRASGHRGFAAQAGLWFNPSVTVELGEGSARLAGVNERVVEIPFALGTLARLAPSARVLEIGSAESTFALSVASLGHHVTALDLHPLPYSHPNIESVVGRFEDWDPGSTRFDAVYLISTIEHFGLGAYGEPPTPPGADRAAITRVAELLHDEGFMVLTTPYGPAAVDALERTYDEKSLSALLDGWNVIERRTVMRMDDQTWIPADDTATKGQQGVTLVVAAPAHRR